MSLKLFWTKNLLTPGCWIIALQDWNYYKIKPGYNTKLHYRSIPGCRSELRCRSIRNYRSKLHYRTVPSYRSELCCRSIPSYRSKLCYRSRVDYKSGLYCGSGPSCKRKFSSLGLCEIVVIINITASRNFHCVWS